MARLVERRACVAGAANGLLTAMARLIERRACVAGAANGPAHSPRAPRMGGSLPLPHGTPNGRLTPPCHPERSEAEEGSLCLQGALLTGVHPITSKNPGSIERL